MQHGVIAASQPHGLPLRFPLLPQYLRPLGYNSRAVGKWHLGHHRSSFTPTARGFQSFCGYLTGKKDYFDHSNAAGRVHTVLLHISVLGLNYTFLHVTYRTYNQTCEV